jgi:hypothetical protein
MTGHPDLLGLGYLLLLENTGHPDLLGLGYLLNLLNPGLPVSPVNPAFLLLLSLLDFPVC